MLATVAAASSCTKSLFGMMTRRQGPMKTSARYQRPTMRAFLARGVMTSLPDVLTPASYFRRTGNDRSPLDIQGRPVLLMLGSPGLGRVARGGRLAMMVVPMLMHLLAELVPLIRSHAHPALREAVAPMVAHDAEAAEE